MEISRRMIQRLTRSRGITHNRRAAFLGRSVKTGDEVAVRVAGRETETLTPQPMDLAILFEDADLLVLDKPAGIIVHPTSSVHERTLAHAVAHHFRQQGLSAKVRPVHRLDREASGLLVVATNAFAHQHLDRQIRDGRMTREYLAVVQGKLDEASGVVDAPIARVPGGSNLRTVRPGGQRAVTRFETIERLWEATIVRAELETGRTHQIRVHFAHLGHPLVGDKAYGARPDPRLGRYALHASRIRFTHPTTTEVMEFEAAPPADLSRLLERLRAVRPI